MGGEVTDGQGVRCCASIVGGEGFEGHPGALAIGVAVVAHPSVVGRVGIQSFEGVRYGVGGFVSAAEVIARGGVVGAVIHLVVLVVRVGAHASPAQNDAVTQGHAYGERVGRQVANQRIGGIHRHVGSRHGEGVRC